MSKLIEVKSCNRCPFYMPEDHDIDIYHGCAVTHYPASCGKNSRQFPYKHDGTIPEWCPLPSDSPKAKKK